MILRGPIRNLAVSRRMALFALIIINLTGIKNASSQQASVPKTNEEQIQELHKRYTFEELLNRNPGAIEADKQLFVLSSDPIEKRRIAGILMRIGVKDQVYFDYLTSGAKETLTGC